MDVPTRRNTSWNASASFGFGMLIARQVADELVYNERRKEVLMIKHLA